MQFNCLYYLLCILFGTVASHMTLHTKREVDVETVTLFVRTLLEADVQNAECPLVVSHDVSCHLPSGMHRLLQDMSAGERPLFIVAAPSPSGHSTGWDCARSVTPNNGPVTPAM